MSRDTVFVTHLEAALLLRRPFVPFFALDRDAVEDVLQVQLVREFLSRLDVLGVSEEQVPRRAVLGLLVEALAQHV